jgi:GT2 family glycosyltransferase
MVSPRISVCILAGHGADALEACLTSLRSQVSAPSFELLIGGNPDAELLSVIHRHFPEAKICFTARRRPGAARNLLTERARGDLLLFLDDDVTARPDLLYRLADAADVHLDVSVFGGPNVTPPSSSDFQVVQGAVLSSLVGAGPVSRRYGARHAGSADERWFTLCNLAVRRQAMLPFLSELVCAEENAVLAQLRTDGKKMRYEPGMRVFHARRSTLRSFATQMFKYGRGRGQLLTRQPRTFRAAYVSPTVLLIYLLLLPALIAATGQLALALAPIALYGALVCATATRVASTLQKLTTAPLAAALIFTVHACYGVGVLHGLLLSRRASRPLEQPAARWISADASLAAATPAREPSRTAPADAPSPS